MNINSESIKLRGVSDPGQNKIKNVTWEVLEGNAVIDSGGNLSITEDTAIGEKILVQASSLNPNYGRTFDESVGYVNTQDKVLTDVIELENQYTMPLKSLTILEDGWEVACKSVALHAKPSPNVSDYSQVTWSVVNGGGSIDNNGIYSIAQGASGDPVTVKATSTVNPEIFATATIHPTFSNAYINVYGEEETVDININVIYNSGGTYADFHAYATPVLRLNTASTFDKDSSLDTNVSWRIRMAWGKQNENDNWVKFFTTPYPTPTITTDGNYEVPHFVGNRLWLASATYTSKPYQRISIEAVLNGDNGTIVKTRGCTYDFKYDENIVPVEDIQLKTGITLFNGVITTNSNGSNGTIIFNANDRNDYPLSGLFEPTDSVYENGVYKRESDGKTYNFDPNRVQFAHTDGNYHSNLCTLHQTREVRAEYGVNGSEEWEVSYPYCGEPYYGTREWNYNQYNTQLKKIYTVKNKIRKKVDARITGPDVPNEALTSVKMSVMGNPIKTTTYTGGTTPIIQNENANFVLVSTEDLIGIPRNGSISVVNQNGDPIFNSKGEPIQPLYTMNPLNENNVEKYYCRVNPLGHDIRVYSTGGQDKTITIETNIGNFRVVGEFKVKCP